MAILLIIFIAILIIYVQDAVYKRKCFDNVFMELQFKDSGVFEGEKTRILETIGNKKWLMLWWILTEYKTSNHLIFNDNGSFTASNTDASYRKDLFSLSSYQKVTRYYDIIAAKRGYFKIDKATIKTGDLFGLNRFLMDVPVSTEIFVYPALIGTNELDIQFERMMGEIISSRKLIDDPFLIRGIRDYMEFDSLKTVNWNATARSGELKVNEYDYTSSKEVMLLLNIEKFNAWDGEGTIEESIRIAASIASECIKGGIPVGLKSNGYNCITNEVVEVDTSNSPDYQSVFYQSLACLDANKAAGSFCDTLKSIENNSDKQPLYVLISQYYGDDIQEEVEEMRANGFNVYWILPKYQGDKLKMDSSRNLFVWEVAQK